MDLAISIDQECLTAFCVGHHITKLAFFGSVLRPDFGPESDVDVLMEFDPAHIPTFLDMYDMEQELTKMIKRKVDLRTPNELSGYFRDEVVRSAAVQYAA